MRIVFKDNSFFAIIVIVGDVMKILCIGHASYDITLPVFNFPKENTKTRIGEIIKCGGGPASNAAYLLAKWNMEVSFAGVVGNDLHGKSIKEEFEKVGVDTKYLEQLDKAHTAESFIIANTKTGTRTILTSKAKSAKYTYLPEGKFDAILVDGEELEASRYAIEQNKESLKVIDAGRVRPSTLELCPLVDYVICSKEFAEEFTNKKIDVEKIETLIQIYDDLEQAFHNKIVITLEERGCFIKSEEYKIIPSIKVKAVDTTGAGDIFHGAFLYFLLQNRSLEETARLANITGALSTQTIGGRFSCPNLEDVLESNRKHDVS